MGNFTLVDAMYRDGFTCSLSGMIMGETVELLAREYGISRDASEAYALETQRRAGAAINSGRFRDELAPVTITDPKGRSVTVDADEHARPDTTIESLRKLPPVFATVEGEPGTITAGTSSGITDGGAALVLMSGDAGAGTRAEADGADHRLGVRGRGSAAHGHRSGPGRPQAVRADRPHHEGLRPGRVERGLCGAGARGFEG